MYDTYSMYLNEMASLPGDPVVHYGWIVDDVLRDTLKAIKGGESMYLRKLGIRYTVDLQ